MVKTLGSHQRCGASKLTGSMKIYSLLIVLLLAVPVAAQTPPARPETGSTPAGSTLRVVVRNIPPFVINENGQYRGFSIDLWEDIAEQLGVKTKFVEQPTVKSLLSMVQSGQADVGIAAISITAEREKTLDFSQPMFDAGLQIMVRASDGGTASIWQILSSPTLLPLLSILPLLILIPSHIIWLVERRHNDGLLDDTRYLPGIGKAIWWAAGTVGAQADEMPRSPLGRFFAVLMMFAGVVFVAFFTAALTSALTVQQLRGDIQGPQDLPGKRVATTAGSTAAAYLRKNRARVVAFPRIEQAYEALEKNEVQAVVFDAPVLLYYAANKGADKVQVVGSMFNEEDYGIAVETGSPLRKRINRALLALRENGEYQALYDKWFNQES